MLISLVGKSGSGKTTIAKELEKIDPRVLHIDVDKISHYVLTLPEVKTRIKTEISPSCIVNDEVIRKALGKIVFEDPTMMDVLTDITWPSMEKVIDETINENPNKIILLDWVLLPKTKYFDQSDLRIWVDSPVEERYDRVVKRAKDKETITKEYFYSRDASGTNYEEGKYDVVIQNTNKTNLNKEVQKVYEKSIISG